MGRYIGFRRNVDVSKVGDNLVESNRWEEFNLIIDTLDLDIKEKGLLLIIFRYVNHKTGYANPSRALLKKLYGTNKNDVIDKVLNSLINKGYLYRESGKGIRSKYFLKLGTKIEPSTKTELSSNTEPILGTEIEPIVGTKIEPQKEKEKKTKEKIYIDIINYLNEKSNKKYRSNTPKTKALINTRLKEGFTEEDFYKVIDIKTIEWKNTDFENYLRPETLFGNKFEGYLNTELKTMVKQKKSKNYFEA